MPQPYGRRSTDAGRSRDASSRLLRFAVLGFYLLLALLLSREIDAAASATTRISIRFPTLPVLYQPQAIAQIAAFGVVAVSTATLAPYIGGVSGEDVVTGLAGGDTVGGALERAGWVTRMGGAELGCGLVYQQEPANREGTATAITLSCL